MQNNVHVFPQNVPDVQLVLGAVLCLYGLSSGGGRAARSSEVSELSLSLLRSCGVIFSKARGNWSLPLRAVSTNGRSSSSKP